MLQLRRYIIAVITLTLSGCTNGNFQSTAKTSINTYLLLSWYKGLLLVLGIQIRCFYLKTPVSVTREESKAFLQATRTLSFINFKCI